MSWNIEPAKIGELHRILEVYDNARRYMAINGNPNQWGISGYPQKELLETDIEKERLFVIKEAGEIWGAFAFMLGDEPTYRVIKKGEWLSHSPYGTIHRLAAMERGRGIAYSCISYCFNECRREGADLRADTHNDNLIMQHILEKYGFIRCGIIYVADGSPRLAYQRLIYP